MNKADLLIKCQHIYCNQNNPSARGFIAIKNNRILYVGNKNTEEFIDSNTKIVDYSDYLIIPGLNDAHTHFMMSAFLKSGISVSLEGTTSEQEAVKRLENTVKNTPEGEWIIGNGWHHLFWKENRLPTKKSLDKVYPHHPILLSSFDGHKVWVNSCALKNLGIKDDVKDTESGHYGRDEFGHLDGILYESVGVIASAKVKAKFQGNQSKKWLTNYIKEANSFGITSVSELSSMTGLFMPAGKDFIPDNLYQDLLEEDKLNIRVHMFPPLLEDLSRTIEMANKYRHTMLQFSGVKHFVDGVIDTHTAYLLEPYSNPYYENDRGSMILPEEKLEKLIFKAIQNDFSVRLHAIGDGAVHIALNIFEKAEKLYGKKEYLQHCLEHLEMIGESDIIRLRDLNVIASYQPAHGTYDFKEVEEDVGEERSHLMWPFRTLIDRGVKLAFGTDTPVVSIHPFEGIYNAVTRKSLNGKPEGGWQPQEKISVVEAIHAYTYGSACAVGRENELGTIEAGKLADLVVLDKNILTCSQDEIPTTKSILTIVNGKIVYKAHGEL